MPEKGAPPAVHPIQKRVLRVLGALSSPLLIEGEGGTIAFLTSNRETESDGTMPILVAGEEAGLELPYGCREGICHTCVGELRSGRVRDLRNGEVYGQEGEVIRTCMSAPEGPIEIDL